MYQKILVPLDGSVFGEHALPVALAIARCSGAEVELAHVHVPAAPPYAGSELIANVSLESVLWEHEQCYLDDIARRAKEAGGRVAVSARVLDGSVGEALSARVRATGADLVVMTTHGRGPLGRLLLGSFADQLVRRADVPLLLVRPGEALPDFAADSLPRRVLVPLDGSPLAEEILGPATSLAKLMKAEVVLMRIVPPALSSNYPTPSEGIKPFGEALLKQLENQEAAARREAGVYLEGVARRLRSEGLTVATRVASNDRPAAAILEQAQVDATDLIALETHGRHGITRLFLGSVADKVLREASVPMLVQRPQPGPAGQIEPETMGKHRDERAVVPPSAMTTAPDDGESDRQPGCYHGNAFHAAAR